MNILKYSLFSATLIFIFIHLSCIYLNTFFILFQTQRFSEEVANDKVALSGMKFFYLTRGLVLSVAGTIVTYELVLLQFHEDGKNIDKISDYIC